MTPLLPYAITWSGLVILALTPLLPYAITWSGLVILALTPLLPYAITWSGLVILVYALAHLQDTTSEIGSHPK